MSDQGIKFEDLPNPVQEIGLRKIGMSSNESELMSHLESCEELRIMTDTPGGSSVKEIGPIISFYRQEASNAK
ncbi:MAG: hypothetical protein DSZ27_08495 [Thiomicrospira sp.]|nr:MAG: hypothetical protein DSZ27_08495 [Thiomicrospira sp.]